MNDNLQYESDALPANVDAERTILGAVLLDNLAFAEAAELVEADDFSLDSHRRIFLRMAQLMQATRAVDIVTLANELSKNKEVESIGGVAYLASLTEGLPRRPVIGEYLRIIKDKSLLRKTMAVCGMAIAHAADQSESALEIIGTLQNRLEDVALANRAQKDMESVGQWLGANDVFAERVPGIKTGIDDYDEMTYGLHPGELTVVAARTSVGKTSHCGSIAWQMAMRGHCVAVFINEQQKRSFMGRMLCGRAGVAFDSYRRGNLDWVEKQYVETAVKEFQKLPLFWDQRSSMSIASIRALAHRLKRSGELDVILIDQLSRVSTEGIERKGMRGDEIIGAKVRGIHSVGMDLDVPVVLYHQLNRGTEKNDGGRPTLANLKNSGDIEEECDNVALLHRPGYYNRDDASLKGKAEIVIAKQRDGMTGTIECEFRAETCSWRNKETKR